MKKVVKKEEEKKVEDSDVSLHDRLIDSIDVGSRNAGQCYTISYLADMYNISSGTVYRHIRIARRSGTGVLITPRGVVLAKNALQADFLHQYRKECGKRLSSIEAVISSASDATRTFRNAKQEIKATVKGIIGDFTEKPATWTCRIDIIYETLESYR